MASRLIATDIVALPYTEYWSRSADVYRVFRSPSSTSVRPGGAARGKLSRAPFVVKSHQCNSARREEAVVAKDAPGMRGNRSRDLDGRLRDTRDDKFVGTLEAQYGRDFGVRSDMHVGTLLEQTGMPSVKKL